MEKAPRSRLRRVLQRVALVAVAFLLPVFVLEIAARLGASGSPTGLIAPPLRTSMNLDMPDLFEFHPQLFWMLRSGLDVNEFPWADRTTPRRFRGVRPIGPKTSTPRVVCLGDSCTYGLGVAHTAAWPAVLRAETGLDVVNAAVPGYTSYQGVIRWDLDCADLQADVIVIEFGINDALSWPTFDGKRAMFLSDVERAEHIRLIALAQKSAVLTWVLSKRLAPVPVITPDTIAEVYAAPPRVSLDEFEANLRRLVAVAPTAVLVAWPRRSEVDPEFVEGHPPDRHPAYNRVLRAVAADQHGFVDVTAEFRSSRLPPDEFFIDYCHATEAAHRVVAAAVAREIERLRAK